MASSSSGLTRKEKALVEIFLQALCYVHESHSSLFEDNVNERDVCSHLLSFIEHSKENTWFKRRKTVWHISNERDYPLKYFT